MLMQSDMRVLLREAGIWAYRACGAMIAIGVMEWLGPLSGEPLSRVPFVTSIVLTMAVPTSPAARPAAIVMGHMLSTACGFVCMALLGANAFASSVAVGCATVLMLAFGVIHPPAGIDAFLVPAFDLPARWIVSPVLIGSVMLALYANAWAAGERIFIRRGADDGAR